MKELIKSFKYLESDFAKLNNLINVMTISMQAVEDTMQNSNSSVVELQDIIDELAADIYKKIDSFNLKLFDKYYKN